MDSQTLESLLGVLSRTFSQDISNLKSIEDKL